MKTKLTIALLFVIISSMADDAKFLQVMKPSIELLYKAQTIEQYQQSINTLNRIADAEKTKWEPYYYAAFGYLMIANKETDVPKKDQWIDLASKAIEKAKAIDPNESEIVALDGFIQMMRVTVDPATRGQEYSGKAMALFGKALSLNPENPRALAMMAQMQIGTAKFLNSSTAEGCSTALRAKGYFQTFHSENPIAPLWGKEMNDDLAQSCK